MFTRQKYDKNSYKQDLYESTSSGRYQLLDKSTYRNNDTCFQATPEIHATNKVYRLSEKNDMVNLESDLFNLVRKDSKDPRSKFPYVKAEYNNLPKLSDCSKTDLARNYPLLDGNQFNREKEIQVPRFQSLGLNPQLMSRVRSNNFIGQNTRLFYRDNDQPKIPVVQGVQGLPSKYDAAAFQSPLISNLKNRKYSNLIEQANAMKKQNVAKSGMKEGFQSGGSCGCSGGAMRR